MSNIKSPFLNKEESLQSFNDDNKAVDIGAQNSVQNSEQRIINSNDENNIGSLEIKDHGRVLKNIIVLMIILLILALLGLAIYNLLNKQNKPLKNDNIDKIKNVEVDNFEMNSGQFKAGSMVVE